MGMHALQLSCLVVGLVSSDACAQHVYKCVAGDQVAYQSAPCAEGATTVKAWSHGSYEPPREADLQRIREIEQANRPRDMTSQASRKVRRSQPQASTKRTSTIGRCQDAKTHRDRELYRLGPWRKMQDLRKWDGYVAQACKF
ncbi:hypothetical protein GCM10027400_00260 [Pseudoxanthomonas daejeonensis]